LRRGNQEGFILAATLWIIAILSLIAASVTATIEESLQTGFATRSEVEALRRSEEAQATALYWLGTRYMSQRGLEIVAYTDLAASQARDVSSAPILGRVYIALDDRPYRYGQSQIRLQDARGLININATNGGYWSWLLGRLGVAPEDQQPMVAKLHDYIDPSPYKTLNGAKRAEYEAAGRSGPRGARLVTPWELDRVLDWDRLDAAGFDTNPLFEDATAASVAGFNFNTAPALVLSAFTGLDDAAVSRIIVSRTSEPFTDISQVALASGTDSVPNALLAPRFLPSDSLRVTVAAPDAALERIVGVRLTPRAEDRPWQIDYSLDLPTFPDHRIEANVAAPDFPDPAHFPTHD
jgi:general secretion pathway protein K